MSKHGPKNLPMDEVIDKYSNQMKMITELAKEYQVTYVTMKNKLVKAGIQLRDKKEEKKRSMNKPETKERVSRGSKRSAGQRKKTNLEKYGHETAMCAPEVKAKWQEKHEKDHGVKWGTQRQDTINKRKETLMKEHGVDNSSKIPDVKEKISQNRWKNKTKEELEEIKNKVISTYYKNNTVNVVTEILNFLDLELLDEYKNGEIVYNFYCKVCKNKFKISFNALRTSSGCPFCNPRHTERVSKGEKEVVNFLVEIGIKNIIKSSKQIIYPYELDIYLSDYNLAIEYNGLWFHCENGPNKISENYHLIKSNLCKKIGIQLIHIFEDEWIFKKEIIKNKLSQLTNTSNKPKVYARKCYITEISPSDKNKFLNQFHVQGNDTSKIKLGAFYNNELVSVMTFSLGSISKGSKLIDGIWELNRFCSNSEYNIVGIAGKLLTYFKRNYEWNKIFTYADKRWSNGNLYFKLGFEYVHNSRPNYWYTKNLERHHRYNFRKQKDDPKDIPEWALRLNEGYHRIWDCGHMKFELRNNKEK